MRAARLTRRFVAGSLLLASGILRTSTAQTAPPQSKDWSEIQKVTEWSLHVSVTLVHASHDNEGEGLHIIESAHVADNRTAAGTAELLLAAGMPPEVAFLRGLGQAQTPGKKQDEKWLWQGPATGKLLIDRYWESYDTVSNLKEFKSTTADGHTPALLKVTINFTQGTYEFSIDGSRVPVFPHPKLRTQITGHPIDVTTLEEPPNPPKKINVPTILNITVQKQPLPTKGTTLKGRVVTKLPTKEKKIVTWTLVPKSKLPRLVIERANDAFLPAPGQSTGITLHWDHGKPDELELALQNISREPGVCLNSPDRGTGDDVEFTGGQAGLTVNGHRATSHLPLKRIDVSTSDYAAYAEVSARGRFGKFWVDAESPEGEPVVSIVPDEDKNKISDVWQESVDSDKKAATYDEDAIPRQAKKKGDNLTLFEEYRGLLIKGGRHRRCDPRRMEVILTDENKIWNEAIWTKCTGASSIVIDSTQHDARRVNFNSAYAASPTPKYAVELVKVSSMSDPEGTAVEPHIWGQTDGSIADVAARSRIFDARPRAGLTNVIPTLVRNAIANPSSADGQRLQGLGFTPALLNATNTALLNAAIVDRQQARLVLLTVIHEVAHACDVDHHSPDTEKGVMNCPMRNLTDDDKLFRMAKEITTSSKDALPLAVSSLCTASDNCWSQLRLKH